MGKLFFKLQQRVRKASTNYFKNTRTKSHATVEHFTHWMIDTVDPRMVDSSRL